MDKAQPVFASLAADMIRRPRFAGNVDGMAIAALAGPSDLRWFMTAFVGGFIFFSALIA